MKKKITYNDVPLSPGNKATGLHGPDMNSLIYCYYVKVAGSLPLMQMFLFSSNKF